MQYTIQQVIERTGLAQRTIRDWTSRGVVARPLGRGPGTRYTEDHVLRLMAVQRLREQGMALRTVKSELRRMSLAQVAAFVGEPLEEPPDAGTAPTPAALPPASEPDGQDAIARAPDAAPLPPGQPFVIAWLLPQLGIIVGQNAPPIVRRIAAEIFERYAATGEASGPPAGIEEDTGAIPSRRPR
ncbi:MAG TPA: helix-turn-helix domain-containing protein [Polyangiaceae bacterium]